MAVFGTNIANEIDLLPDHKIYGQVRNVVGMLIETGGIQASLSVGDHCDIHTRDDRRVRCEVIGFSNNRAMLMPFTSVEGVGMGCRVELSASSPVIHPHASWLGRVINAFGEPVDGKGPLGSGPVAYPIHNTLPPTHERQRVGGKSDFGVRTMNAFVTCCKGQRLGIFTGSSVGKSTLMSMMARNTDAEVSVVGMSGAPAPATEPAPPAVNNNPLSGQPAPPAPVPPAAAPAASTPAPAPPPAPPAVAPPTTPPPIPSEAAEIIPPVPSQGFQTLPDPQPTAASQHQQADVDLGEVVVDDPGQHQQPPFADESEKE